MTHNPDEPLSQGLRLCRICWISGFLHNSMTSSLCATRTDVGSYSMCRDSSRCSEPLRPVGLLVFRLEVVGSRTSRLAFSCRRDFHAIPARMNILLQSAQPGARILRTFDSMRKRGDKLIRSLRRVRKGESGGTSTGVEIMSSASYSS